VSTIPFYHAGEASIAIRKVMGNTYRADTKTPFMTAFWRNQKACKFVEESVEGSGVWFFRNLHGVGVEPKDLTGGKAQESREIKAHVGTSGHAMMASSRSGEAKRRFSGGFPATLPLLAE
jgi:omega-6 fatty acid desaturase (delta-12 desaturase)